MKNICFLDPDLSIKGGAERVVFNLTQELAKKYNVHLISIWNKNGKLSYERPDNVQHIFLNTGVGRRREVYLKSFFKLVKYIRKENIEVIFFINTYAVSFVRLLKLFVKAKLVFCDHGAIRNEIDSPFNMRYRKLAAEKCDKVVTLTDRNLEDYKTIFGASQSKVVCIPNWISEEVLKTASSNYNINSKKIITVGRFGKEKGYDMLVDIANIVLKKYPSWQWDLYGDGETFTEIKTKITEYNLQNKLILKGQVNDIYNRYKNYAIYVLSSYREGLPLVLLEAKANYLPVVSFDCITGPREIITNGVEGFLIACYDKEKMADRISELIENKELRIRMSNNSRCNLDKFDKRRILSKWESIIDNI